MVHYSSQDGKQGRSCPILLLLNICSILGAIKRLLEISRGCNAKAARNRSVQAWRERKSGMGRGKSREFTAGRGVAVLKIKVFSHLSRLAFGYFEFAAGILTLSILLEILRISLIIIIKAYLCLKRIHQQLR